MKTLISTGNRMVTTFAFLLAILSITISCTESDVDKGPLDETPDPSPKPKENEVWIQSMSFNPSSFTVAVGTRVTWLNKDDVLHTVTSDSRIFDSGNIGEGGSFSYTFSTAGTFPYHCTYHTSMTAEVVVEIRDVPY